MIKMLFQKCLYKTKNNSKTMLISVEKRARDGIGTYTTSWQKFLMWVWR